ncbi:MAG: hypothetical protein JSS66_09390 [Armatimonadetes bacterium]|nr:hypothetical protein [Armatimonadota bacterium]
MFPLIGALTSIVAHLTAPQPFVIQYVGEAAGLQVRVCLDGRKVETCYAGKLLFRDKDRSWSSVCAAVRAPVGRRQAYVVQALNSSRGQANVKLAGAIVAKWFDQAQTPAQCAGLQLAVWEAIEDGGSRADFGSGHFMAQASTEALQFAMMAYQDPGGDTSGSAYLKTTDKGSGGGQSQMTPFTRT